MSPFDKSQKKMNCKDVAPLLVFYVCEEVDESERALIEMHLATCHACSEQLADERAFHSALVSAPQSVDELDASGILLSQCRSELEEALDDLSAPPLEEHWRPFGWLRRWMALRPAWSGAMLVLVGILAGAQLVPWMQRNSNNTGQAMNVRAPQPLTPDQFRNMVVSGVNFSPSSGSDSPTVQVQLSAEQPMVLTGTVEDPNMRRALTYVVENGERFDAGVRLDCLDALKAAVRDVQVRSALLSAARKDQNPAVRMKALEALREAAGEDDVREAILDALEHDNNPGVRVEAVNLLVGALQGQAPDTDAAPNALEAPVIAPAPGAPGSEDASFEQVVKVLQELQRRDPNRYVRLRSAAALRQIGPREVQ
ncbi:MAG TPA: HEAT repeat domain-containing protein [Candidatus Acidoferrum sp.]|nr:HEAT repeat domain-containing protein [Candidatus Acidoferrum sp.]